MDPMMKMMEKMMTVFTHHPKEAMDLMLEPTERRERNLEMTILTRNRLNPKVLLIVRMMTTVFSRRRNCLLVTKWAMTHKTEERRNNSPKPKKPLWPRNSEDKRLI